MSSKDKPHGIRAIYFGSDNDRISLEREEWKDLSK